MDWVPLAGIAVGFGLLVIVPVVAIMTEHQRKMARILHGQKDDSADKLEAIGMVIHGKGSGNEEIIQELRALRTELQDVKSQVAGLTAERAAADAELRQTLGRE